MASTNLIHNLARAAIGCAFSLAAFGVSGASSQTSGRNPDALGGIPCRMAYESPLTDLTISDHSDTDNTAIGDIVMVKSCRGPVVGTISAEITGNLHIHQFGAFCVGGAGLPGGCTRGQRLDIRVHTLLAPTTADEVSRPVHTVRWVWPNVPPGRWRFRLLPAVFSPVTVKRRTFTVEAYRAF